jgi:hypothetical protein
VHWLCEHASHRDTEDTPSDSHVELAQAPIQTSLAKSAIQTAPHPRRTKRSGKKHS